jgi:hypothetical protein
VPGPKPPATIAKEATRAQSIMFDFDARKRQSSAFHL